MDTATLITVVLTVIGAMGGGAISALVVAWFSRRKTNAEAEAFIAQIEQGKDKAKREAEDWVTERYKELAKKYEERVNNLEKEMASLKAEIRNEEDALEYLMDEVRPDFPVAVFVAGEIATGKRKRPINGNDPTENHDS